MENNFLFNNNKIPSPEKSIDTNSEESINKNNAVEKENKLKILNYIGDESGETEFFDDSKHLFGGEEREYHERSNMERNLELVALETNFIRDFSKNLSEIKKEPVFIIYNARAGLMYSNAADNWSDQIVNAEDRKEFADELIHHKEWPQNKELAIYRIANEWIKSGKLDSFVFSTKNFKFASFPHEGRSEYLISESSKKFLAKNPNVIIVDPSQRPYPQSFFYPSGYEFINTVNWAGVQMRLKKELSLIGYDYREDRRKYDDVNWRDSKKRIWYSFEDFKNAFPDDNQVKEYISQKSLYDFLVDYGYKNTEIDGLSLREVSTFEVIHKIEDEKNKKTSDCFRDKHNLHSGTSLGQVEYYPLFGNLGRYDIWSDGIPNEERMNDAVELIFKKEVENKNKKVILLNPNTSGDRPFWDNYPQMMGKMALRYTHEPEEKVPTSYKVETNKGVMEYSDFLKYKIRELSGWNERQQRQRKLIHESKDDELSEIDNTV